MPAELNSDAFVPAMPARPREPLSTWALLNQVASGTLGVFDEELYREPFVKRRYGLVTACFVSDPAGVKRVLVDNFGNYPRLPTVRRLFEAEIGTGTLASEGETWRRHRRVATPAIDQRAIQPDIPHLIDLAEAAADRLDAKADGQTVDVERFAARLVVRMLNQFSTGGEKSALPIFKWLSTVPRKPRGFDVVPKPEWLSKMLIRKRRDGGRPEADALLRELIGRRLEAGYSGSRDLFWRLVNTSDRQTGDPLSAEEGRDEAASIIAAGDTMIRPLTWIWYLLDSHPNVDARLQAELADVLGDRRLEPSDLSRLPFLKSVLDETMRLYPPVPVIVRRARRSDEICGQRVPRGAIVTVAPFIIHRHQALWWNPDAFDPDRFSAEAKAERSRFAYIPFATGPRVCVGSSAATTGLMIACATIARRFRFKLATTKPIEPFGGVSLQPKGGMPMRVERR